MNVREWFGINTQVDDTPANRHVNTLLSLFKSGLSKYFRETESIDIIDFLSTVGSRYLSDIDRKFLDWFQFKGAPLMKRLAAESLPDTKEILNKLESEIFSLEGINFDNKEELRSYLIIIVEQLEKGLFADK